MKLVQHNSNDHGNTGPFLLIIPPLDIISVSVLSTWGSMLLYVESLCFWTRQNDGRGTSLDMSDQYH